MRTRSRGFARPDRRQAGERIAGRSRPVPVDIRKIGARTGQHALHGAVREDRKISRHLRVFPGARLLRHNPQRRDETRPRRTGAGEPEAVPRKRHRSREYLVRGAQREPRARHLEPRSGNHQRLRARRGRHGRGRVPRMALSRSGLPGGRGVPSPDPRR